jgi:hypothetical protein
MNHKAKMAIAEIEEFFYMLLHYDICTVDDIRKQMPYPAVALSENQFLKWVFKFTLRQVFMYPSEFKLIICNLSKETGVLMLDKEIDSLPFIEIVTKFTKGGVILR